MLAIAEHVVSDYRKDKMNALHEQLSEEMQEELPAQSIIYCDRTYRRF
jgi:hypothetical protein